MQTAFAASARGSPGSTARAVLRGGSAMAGLHPTGSCLKQLCSCARSRGSPSALPHLAGLRALLPRLLEVSALRLPLALAFAATYGIPADVPLLLYCQYRLLQPPL